MKPQQENRRMGGKERHTQTQDGAAPRKSQAGREERALDRAARTSLAGYREKAKRGRHRGRSKTLEIKGAGRPGKEWNPDD